MRKGHLTHTHTLHAPPHTHNCARNPSGLRTFCSRRACASSWQVSLSIISERIVHLCVIKQPLCAPYWTTNTQKHPHKARTHCKQTDFGLAIDLRRERAVTRAGTLNYMPPEVCELGCSVCSVRCVLCAVSSCVCELCVQRCCLSRAATLITFVPPANIQIYTHNAHNKHNTQVLNCPYKNKPEENKEKTVGHRQILHLRYTINNEYAATSCNSSSRPR